MTRTETSTCDCLYVCGHGRHSAPGPRNRSTLVQR
jgi:hypothetical protein